MFAEAAAQGAVMAAQEVLEAALASRPRQHGKISSGLFSVAGRAADGRAGRNDCGLDKQESAFRPRFRTLVLMSNDGSRKRRFGVKLRKTRRMRSRYSLVRTLQLRACLDWLTKAAIHLPTLDGGN